jgi:hypothetical protein
MICQPVELVGRTTRWWVFEYRPSLGRALGDGRGLVDVLVEEVAWKVMPKLFPHLLCETSSRDEAAHEEGARQWSSAQGLESLQGHDQARDPGQSQVVARDGHQQIVCRDNGIGRDEARSRRAVDDAPVE